MTVVVPTSNSAGLTLLFMLLTHWTPNLMADQTDKRLDALFSRLQSTSDIEEGAKLTETIWAIWHESRNATVNELMQQGLEQMADKDYHAAIATFSQMIEVDPNFAEGWNKRATVYYLVGNFAASVKDIDRTLELEPRHFGALSGLGLIMLAMDNEEAALQAFEATLAVNPFVQGARQNLRELKERQKKRTL